MRIMYIYMHPAYDSFNGAIFQAIQEKLPEVDVFSPGTESFEPKLTIEEYQASMEGHYAPDVKEAQAALQKADHVIFQFPLWWGSFPAPGKGFIDRVFAYGIAYELEGETPVPLLNGTKASLVFTTGSPPDEFHTAGLYENVVTGIDKHLLQFCGLELAEVLHFGDVIQESDEARQKMLEKAAAFAETLHGK
ncbi:NAD(P)H-dependent oxidoreductase [Alkalicoccus daliensis]|uniref:NAD(P)H dehydrogenase (Quinone) n=1 Tax=Alkalicoccus daliensis TaxID=745820 RepID=A0A1H0CTG7_9BACI|nr:NAD(P)H-dependent oxidoreductase [Alkalicoccus daliensis]SDN61164.1 NAD(P)H dehydrogenase (quinone) [Alkalicoccus daliensis]